MSVANNLAIKRRTTLFECGVRNAERGTTSLHYVPFTRKDYISAERGARSTERPHSANAPLTRKIIFLSV